MSLFLGRAVAVRGCGGGAGFSIADRFLRPRKVTSWSLKWSPAPMRRAEATLESLSC